MIELDFKNDNIWELKVTDSIDLISNYESIRNNFDDEHFKRPDFLDTSIGTIISSSLSSQTNNQTVTLSSIDHSQIIKNSEFIFGGVLDIEEIIRDQEEQDKINLIF